MSNLVFIQEYIAQLGSVQALPKMIAILLEGAILVLFSEIFMMVFFVEREKFFFKGSNSIKEDLKQRMWSNVVKIKKDKLGLS